VEEKDVEETNQDTDRARARVRALTESFRQICEKNGEWNFIISFGHAHGHVIALAKSY
jgi:hypothetical protein